MGFAEILSEIPRRSFAEREEWVRSAIAVDDAELTAEEDALPVAHMIGGRWGKMAGMGGKRGGTRWGSAVIRRVCVQTWRVWVRTRGV